MWTSNLNRDDLIAIAQAEQPKRLNLRKVGFLADVERFSDSLMAVWDESPEDSFQPLPNLLVVPNSKMADHFAWASSYLNIKPFTAFIRTIDFDTLRTISPPRKHRNSLSEGFKGLILAEALTYLEQSSSRLSLRACEGTYSFSVAKSLLHVQGEGGALRTGLNWFRARRALHNLNSRLSLAELQQPWSAIVQALGGDADGMSSSYIASCCKDLITAGEVSDNSWRMLTGGTDLQSVRELMQDTREERVILLDKILQTLTLNASLKPDVASFLAGYLVSMVAPGSLDHWHLLSRVRSLLPTAGLWYGLSAGLRRENRLDAYGGGLGRLVMRELQRRVDPLDRPTCDIALDELESQGAAFKVEALASSSGASIEVEISPCISAPFRAVVKNGSEASELPLDFGQLRPTESRYDERFLSRLDEVIDDLEDIRRDIQKNIPGSDKLYKRRSQKRRSGR